MKWTPADGTSASTIIRAKAKPAEKLIQREILRYLHARGVMAWKAGVGGMYATYKEQDRFIRFGMKGQPDIIGILPGGRFLGIEVKAAKGQITPDQHAFLHLIRHAGGVAFMARSVVEVADILAPHLTKEASNGAPQPVARDAAPAPRDHGQTRPGYRRTGYAPTGPR